MIVLPTIACVSAAAYLVFNKDNRQNALKTITKTIPLTCLAIAVLLGGGPLLLAISFGLSAIGDAALSREGDKAFLIGLGSFLAGHILLILVFLNFAGETGALWHLPVLIALSGLAYGILGLLWNRLGEMRVPVLLYVATILGMGASATMLPSELRLATIGAALFILSDCILSLQLFRGMDAPWVNPAIWIFYFVGQFLIFVTFFV